MHSYKVPDTNLGILHMFPSLIFTATQWGIEVVMFYFAFQETD